MITKPAIDVFIFDIKNLSIAPLLPKLAAIAATLLLAGCGGGGSKGESSESTSANVTTSASVPKKSKIFKSRVKQLRDLYKTRPSVPPNS